jgi:hypothetical protein
MRRLMAVAVLGLALGILSPGLSFGAPAQDTQTVFYGSIGDSMCGLKHTMPGGAKACTVACIKEGSSYILADSEHSRVYKLSNQALASRFAGQNVVIRGRLRGDTIVTYKIELTK